MSELLISRHDRVLQLTLNRPQARNALSIELMTEVESALARLAAGQAAIEAKKAE